MEIWKNFPLTFFEEQSYRSFFFPVEFTMPGGTLKQCIDSIHLTWALSVKTLLHLYVHGNDWKSWHSPCKHLLQVSQCVCLSLCVPFCGSALIKRLWRTCREKSRDTEVRSLSWRMVKASRGNSSNKLSASNTTHCPGSSDGFTTHKTQPLVNI